MEDDDEHPIRTAVVKALLVLSIVTLAGGYLGWLHPLGDSLAVARGHVSAAVFILAILAAYRGMRMAAFGAILLSLLTGTSVVLAFIWPGPPGIFPLYQKNMLYRNDDLAALEADIRASEALALTLQEVSPQNEVLLVALQDVMPQQLHCKTGRRGGMAVASRLPMVPGSERCASGAAAFQVIYDDEPVWIVSVHLHWPWPYGQAEQIDELRPFLAALDGPVLMAGDFNMVRWAVGVRQLAAEARVHPAGPTRGTFTGFGPLLPLPIDHAFAPSGGRITLRPGLGSDHLGLLAYLEP